MNRKIAYPIDFRLRSGKLEWLHFGKWIQDDVFKAFGYLVVPRRSNYASSS